VAESGYWTNFIDHYENALLAWAYFSRGFHGTGGQRWTDMGLSILGRLASLQYGASGFLAEGSFVREGIYGTSISIEGDNLAGEGIAGEPGLIMSLPSMAYLAGLIDRITPVNKSVAVIGGKDAHVLGDASGGGGGLLTHPGMSGGMRG
jgi:hypothetical protein